jgi:hypothetical protein
MIEFIEQESTRTFYVVFDRYRGRKMFWNFFTKDGFDHIYLLTDVGNQTLAITPTPRECLFALWPCTVEEAVKWLPEDTTAIIKYTAKYKSLKSWKCRVIISCVSWAKYVLNIDSLAVTPKQLYRFLDGK